MHGSLHLQKGRTIAVEGNTSVTAVVIQTW